MERAHAIDAPVARIVSMSARALSVALKEPFVIASARMEATRSVEVLVELARESYGAVARGSIAHGWGEAAALPGVTREDQPDVLVAMTNAARALEGRSVRIGSPELAAELDALFPQANVARAGVEMALLDAVARIAGIPLRAMLGGELGRTTRTLTTDITLPIGEPAHMADLARAWHAQGFDVFKVKVGKDVDHDVRALEAVLRAVPVARFRIDANAGFTPRDAIALARTLERGRFVVECYEQPCAAGDLDASAEVAAAVDPPVIADESVATLADLGRIQRARAADGVNLKIVKSGGLLAALRLGREARAAGMPLMMGGMVETRLGMTAGAHVAAALGGVEFVDLDTAWLLDGDPYEGGYESDGPCYELPDEAGLGVRRRPHGVMDGS